MMRELRAVFCILCVFAIFFTGCRKQESDSSSAKSTKSKQETISSADTSSELISEENTSSETIDSNESENATRPVVNNPDRVTDADVASVSFGTKTVSENMTYKTLEGEDLKSGSDSGKGYWQLMSGSGDAGRMIWFTLSQKFLKKASGKDVVFVVEYYANSPRSFNFSYTANNSENLKEQSFPLGSLNTWSGKCLRITDFQPKNGLDGSHFKIELGTNLVQMRIASVKVIIVNKETEGYPKLAATKYNQGAYIVAEENVKYYGAVGDGKSDDTYAFHTAIASAEAKGGGAVYIPAGSYKITQSIHIPTGVTLCGDFSIPDSNGIKGTVLQIYTETEAQGNKTAAFRMLAGSGMKGLVIWYPDQKIKNGKATAYPYTIEMMQAQGITLDYIYLVNSYKGINMTFSANGMENLRHIYGTPLSVGLTFDYNREIARFENIHFSIDWWINSRLPGVPSRDALYKWMTNNAVAMHFEYVEWAYITDFTAKGYKKGIYAGRSSVGNSHGVLYNVNITECNIGLDIEYSNYYGYAITNSVIEATAGNNPMAVRFGDNFINSATFLNCKLSSSGFYTVKTTGSGAVTFQDSELKTTSPRSQYGIHAEKGNIAAANVSYQGAGKFAYLGGSVKRANLVNCMTENTLKIDNNAKTGVLTSAYDSAGKAPAVPSPPKSYALQVKKPGTNKLFLAADYGIVPGGGADMASKLQKAIDAAAAAGGGTVYVPAGIYRLDSKITVKSGVEILGTLASPHHTKNTCTTFFTDYGKNAANDDALFNLQAKSGLRGFTVFYDKQDSDNILPYAFTVRGNGSDISITGVTLTYAYQGIDFKTNRCDNHYIEGVGLGVLKTGIAVGAGSKNGVIRDVLANSHFIGDNLFSGAKRETAKVLQFTWKNLETFSITDSENQVLMNNFTFGAHHGVSVTGQAKNVFFIGQGVDASVQSVFLSGGQNQTASFINTQIVSHVRPDLIPEGYTTPEKNYIRIDEAYQGTANFFQTNVWGGPENAFRISGGTVNLVSGTMFQGGSSVVLAEGGKTTVSGLTFKSHLLADFDIRQGATGFRAFGNTFTSAKTILNNSGITLEGSDCSQ